MSSSPSPSTEPRVAFYVVHRGQRIPLREGENLVGRSSACHVVLDGSIVSRRHATLLVEGERLLVSDLGSRNGVLLNETPIPGQAEVRAGDRLVIGGEILEVVAGAAPRRLSSYVAEGASSGDRVSAPPYEAGSLPTRQASAFELLGGVVDKAIALGRVEEAERLLGTHLATLQADAAAGRDVPADKAESAVRIALKLAAASQRARWIDWVVRLYLTLQAPLPAPVIDEINELVRRIRGTDTILLRHYASTLRGLAHLTPAQRFLVQRIEGLERVALP